MRPSRLGALGALGAVLLVGLAAGVAPAATPPSVTASHAPVAGSPSAISCNGFVDVHVSVTGHAGTTGTARTIILTLDLSGSMAGDNFTDLKRAATDTLDALNAADGSVDHTIGGNSVGIVIYQGATATTIAAPTSNYDALAADISSGLGTPANGSPHDAGINAASSAIASSAGAIVLITDGQAGDGLLTATNTAATNAKTPLVRIVPIGIGLNASDVNLQVWATAASFEQHPVTGGSINTTKLLADLDAQSTVPVGFTLNEALGTHFSATGPVASTGTVTGASTGGTLQWTGSLADNQTATLAFRAQRDNTPVFATTNETVSTMSIPSVSGGGTANVTPPATISVDVLPCGATPIASTTCTGASCSVSGTQGTTQYSASAGNPPAGTSLTLSSLNAAPPTGACGTAFVQRTQGAEYDVRPLTTDSTFKMTISKAALNGRRWFETDVCLGSNLKFITAIRSLSNLSPDATFVPGGTVPGRWWGLLPSIPRFEFFPGRGFVLGPYITSRTVDAAGNASITFKIPFVPNSTTLTTDGKAAYDPKLWGG